MRLPARETRALPSELQTRLASASFDSTNFFCPQDRFRTLCISLCHNGHHPDPHVEDLVHFLCIDLFILLQDLENARDTPAFRFDDRITVWRKNPGQIVDRSEEH